MVADRREFDALFRSHRYPGLETGLTVFEGEHYASVFALALTRGLRTDLRSSR